MDYVKIGRSGLSITQVTFGTALTIGTESLDIGYARSMIDTAWSLGIRSFDCSNNYGYGNAEKLLGLALKEYPRQEFVVSTKGSWPIGDSCYHRGLSRKHILWAFRDSISRMDMDYVDIYYAHRYDPETPMEEIVRVFNHLIESEKILYWATSEWPAFALAECIETCERLNLIKPILEQCLFSFAISKALTNGVVNKCRENGLGVLGFSPLCQGLLTGKYRNGIPKNSRIDKGDSLNYNKTINFYHQNKHRIDNFITLCDKYEVNMTGAALQWVINQEIYPVIGASTPQQLRESIASLSEDIPMQFWDDLNEIFCH